MRTTSTAEFRQTVRRLYPGLCDDRALWSLMRRLLFSTKRDPATNRVIIDWKSLARDEGKEGQARNYRALPFLQRFRQEVMPDFRWEKHSHGRRRARLAVTPWPEELVAALERDRRELSSAIDRVRFATGERWDRRAVAVERNAARREADNRLHALEGREPARELVEYLNGLPPHRFTGLLGNLSPAEEEARRFAADATRSQQLEVLHSIRDQAQQFYQFSRRRRSVRIFPLNAGALMLKKSVRHALCRGWWECDLRSSQLAICARLWGMRRVERFLRDGGNIWRDLAAHFGVDLTDEFKAAAKRGLYALLFGMSRRALTRMLDSSFDVVAWEDVVSAADRPPAGARLFLSHPLIKEAMGARNRRLRELANGETVVTAFGQELVCDGTRKSARSILAREAQAVELWLLMPVVEMARGTDEFQITLWQHDGFSLAFRDRRRAESWLRRITEAVADRARQAGIATGLEVVELGDGGDGDNGDNEGESLSLHKENQEQHQPNPPTSTRSVYTLLQPTLSPSTSLMSCTLKARPENRSSFRKRRTPNSRKPPEAPGANRQRGSRISVNRPIHIPALRSIDHAALPRRPWSSGDTVKPARRAVLRGDLQ